MRGAQRETYGDGVDPALHPYMWAMKPHYYFSSFYNFPYTFGLLFGLGPLRPLRGRPGRLPRRLRRAARPRRAWPTRPTLAARFGIDIRSPAFWRGSLDVIRAEIDRYCASALTGSAGA